MPTIPQSMVVCDEYFPIMIKPARYLLYLTMFHAGIVAKAVYMLSYMTIA